MPPSPDLAFVDEAQGLDHMVGSGVLGQDAARARLEGFPRPLVVIAGSHEEDHGGPVIALGPRAQGDRLAHPAVHEQDIRMGRAQGRPQRGRLVVANHQE